MLKKILLILLVGVSSTFAQEEKVTNFGWTPTPTVNLNYSTNHEHRVADLPLWGDDEDSLTYRFLYEALKESNQLSSKELESGRISSLNQGSVGSCVGYALTNATEVTAAANVFHRKQLRQIWQSRINPDAMYAITRYENLGGWDGSTGAWAAANIAKYGSLHRLQYQSHDLRNTQPTDGRRWASVGLPKELIEAAKAHRAMSCEKITSIEQAQAVIQNGYAIIVCAQASYPSRRDANGFSNRTGRAWSHAMSVIAFRGKNSGKIGFLIQNSWGDTWNNGGIYPEDQPYGSFWVTPEDLMYHINQGDSYAIAGYEGFVRRERSWKEVFTGKE